MKSLIVAGAIVAATVAGVAPAQADDRSSRRDRVVERFDRDGNGDLGPRERMAAWRTHDRADRNDDGRIGARERAAAARAVDRADRNDDGRIGVRERAIAANRVAPGRHAPVAARYDRNGNGVLSRHDYVSSPRVVQRFDRNDDGRLTGRERAAANQQFNQRDRNDNGRIGPYDWRRR